MTKHRKDRGDMILNAIAEYTGQHNYPPTIREIMNMVGLASTSAVWHHLQLLQRDGRLKRNWHKARTYIDKERGVCPTCGAPWVGEEPLEIGDQAA